MRSCCSKSECVCVCVCAPRARVCVCVYVEPAASPDGVFTCLCLLVALCRLSPFQPPALWLTFPPDSNVITYPAGGHLLLATSAGLSTGPDSQPGLGAEHRAVRLTLPADFIGLLDHGNDSEVPVVTLVKIAVNTSTRSLEANSHAGERIPELTVMMAHTGQMKEGCDQELRAEIQQCLLHLFYCNDAIKYNVTH